MLQFQVPRCPHTPPPPPRFLPWAAEEDKAKLEASSAELKQLTDYMKKVGGMAAGCLGDVCWVLGAGCHVMVLPSALPPPRFAGPPIGKPPAM